MAPSHLAADCGYSGRSVLLLQENQKTPSFLHCRNQVGLKSALHGLRRDTMTLSFICVRTLQGNLHRRNALRCYTRTMGYYCILTWRPRWREETLIRRTHHVTRLSRLQVSEDA